MHYRAARRLAVAVLALGAMDGVFADECQRMKLLADDGATHDLFGYSVSVASGQAVLGAVLSDGPTTNFGAVYGYSQMADEWLFSGQVYPVGPGGAFGRCTDLDGARLAVGEDVGIGYVYVFDRAESGAWIQAGQLWADDSLLDDFFGWSVGVSGDFIVVGAYNDSNQNGGEAGSAYVFERDPNGTWSQSQKLIASDGLPGAEFGRAVAIDGGVIVVGAPSQWFGDLPWAGEAYVFEHDLQTGAWVEAATLRPPVSHTFQSFGSAVAIDEDVLAIGASADYAAESLGGAAYVYARDLRAQWRLTAQLVADDPQNSQFFGSSVTLYDSRIVVGAPGDNNPQVSNGAAYVFTREPDGVWREHAKFTASDGQYYDQFGYSVALDGSWAVIGAPYDDDNGADSGSAYIFRVGPDWSGNGVPDICECPGDIDYSGAVGLSDLSALLTSFGLAAGQSYESGDIDGDYDVDLADLSALLERYGTACP